MQNTIDGLDEMDDIDFGADGLLLCLLGEAVGWIVLIFGAVLTMTYLIPTQMSAEADLFEAQVNGEVP